MAVAPGYAHLLVIEILHLDKSLAPRQIVPRHCTSAPLPASCNRDRFPATYQNCTATRVMLNKICAMTAKTRAIPSLHRDNFSAKVPGHCPVLSSGNTTSLYCRAVRWHSITSCWQKKTIISLLHDNKIPNFQINLGSTC
jgi:hypothetical protein